MRLARRPATGALPAADVLEMPAPCIALIFELDAPPRIFRPERDDDTYRVLLDVPEMYRDLLIENVARDDEHAAELHAALEDLV